MNLELALRKKYRFPSPVGAITLEHLWDLPLQSSRAGKTANLDDTAKEINRLLKAQAEESFVTEAPTAAKSELENMLAIVVHIIGVRKAENAAALAESERKKQKEKLLEALEARTTQDLMGKSTEELRAMINAL